MHLAKVDEFLEHVPALFERAQSRERDAYERLIYALAPPAPTALLGKMAQFRGAKAVPALASKDAEEICRRALRVPKYPSAEMLLDMRKIDGLTLPQATMLLHFHHPAYPIYSEAAVATLNRLGFPVVYATEINEDNVGRYEGYLTAIERLKVKIPFEDVPETNCFLSRIVEGALTHAG